MNPPCACGCGRPVKVGRHGKMNRYINGHNCVGRFRDIEASFWARVQKEPGPCWIWTGWKDRQGYGRAYSRTVKTTGAHRVAYQYLVGPIPPDMTLDHLCNTPLCVNPEHLRVCTNSENSRRSWITSPRPIRYGPRVTHCHRGHEYTPENTLLAPRDGRRCRTCVRAKSARWNARVKAAKEAERSATWA